MPIYGPSQGGGVSSPAQIDLQSLPNGAYRMKHAPGDYYAMPKGNNASTGIANNYVYFSPFLVTGHLTIDQLVMWQSGSSGMDSGDKVNVGFYDADQYLKPANLLASYEYEGYFNGTQPLVIPELEFEQGLYYFAVCNTKPDGTNTFYMGQGGAFSFPITDPQDQYSPLSQPNTANGFIETGAHSGLPGVANVNEKGNSLACMAMYRVVEHTV